MNIAVYCSSAEGLSSKWQESARLVGQWIGKHNATLIYGGVDAGLMRLLGQTVKQYGGEVVGVIPTRRYKSISKYNDTNIPSAGLSDRKYKMQILADVFVVLPGGYGTMDEFASTFAHINFTAQRDKRIILYNPDGLFDLLLQQMQLLIDQGLMRRQSMDIVTVTTTPEQLQTALNSLIAK
jgi:uncharacterized protein (TIGR00730 family)